MGEFSKRVGEIGEEVVADFLSLIGWAPLLRNFDIASVDPQKHGKQSHGIDAYFSYPSPMISRTLENIIISVKFSNDRYPNSPVERFKGYYRDIAMAIESFKKSEIRAQKTNFRPDLEAAFDRGVIFWLNNVDNDNSDGLMQKLSRIETSKDFNHDGIFLVDNRRIDFLFTAIQFVRRRFPNRPFEFTYFNTGLNGDSTCPKNGAVMPVQYLASNILPIRIQVDEQNNTLVLCSHEKFESEECIKMMGLAKNITSNFPSRTILAFPDYNRLQHEHLVQRAKQMFEDPYIINALSVENFNQSFRS